MLGPDSTFLIHAFLNETMCRSLIDPPLYFLPSALMPHPNAQEMSRLYSFVESARVEPEAMTYSATFRYRPNLLVAVHARCNPFLTRTI